VVTRLTFTGWVSDLAREHARALAGVARREGLTSDDALDAVQEAFHTFLRLPQARALVAAHDESRALLAVLVKNAARNMRRRHHRARPHEPLDEAGHPAAAPTVEELMAVAEEHFLLLGCVARLDEVQRCVVTMRMLDELSGEAVARALELTPSHVAVLLHRAKRELQRCIGA
jgi:RNA polymerase sigma-70 factor, ECF subfamily